MCGEKFRPVRGKSVRAINRANMLDFDKIALHLHPVSWSILEKALLGHLCVKLYIVRFSFYAGWYFRRGRDWPVFRAIPWP